MVLFPLLMWSVLALSMASPVADKDSAGHFKYELLPRRAVPSRSETIPADEQVRQKRGTEAQTAQDGGNQWKRTEADAKSTANVNDGPRASKQRAESEAHSETSQYASDQNKGNKYVPKSSVKIATKEDEKVKVAVTKETVKRVGREEEDDDDYKHVYYDDDDEDDHADDHDDDEDDDDNEQEDAEDDDDDDDEEEDDGDDDDDDGERIKKEKKVGDSTSISTTSTSANDGKAYAATDSKSSASQTTRSNEKKYGSSSQSGSKSESRVTNYGKGNGKQKQSSKAYSRGSTSTRSGQKAGFDQKRSGGPRAGKGNGRQSSAAYSSSGSSSKDRNVQAKAATIVSEGTELQGGNYDVYRFGDNRRPLDGYTSDGQRGASYVYNIYNSPPKNDCGFYYRVADQKPWTS